MNNKRLTITLFANIVVFLTNSLIGLLMTPFIVERVGAEANGFVSLANNFTNYANILMVALNSMAGRFITIEFHRKNFDKANQYFNSVLIANLIMTLILLVPGVLFVVFADSLINISPQLVTDVKILFALIFLSFFITILGTGFSNAAFIANRKDLDAKRQMESYIIKAAVLIGFFSLLKPHVYYVGISMVLMSCYVFAANVRYTRTLTPELSVKKRFFNKKSVFVLLSSGVWNSVNQLSQILSSGLDLLFANLFLGGAAMGVLSIAKLLPGMVEMFIWQICAIFIPEFTIAYAQSDKKRMLGGIRKSIIISSILSNICMCMVCVLCSDFYTLWVPSQNAFELHALTVLTISYIFVSAGVYCIIPLTTVTNKIRVPALIKVGVGILNTLIVVILLKTTTLGLYAIAGVSSLTNILMNMLFHIPYSAKCIKEKPTIFYKPVVKNIFALGITVLLGFLEKTFFTINSWFSLVLFGIILGLTALVINILVCTTFEEKKQAIRFTKSKLSR